MKSIISDYCATIGKDPLLVQGAGGNISWKEDGKLFIKASGFCLKDAKDKNIFVSVDLKSIQKEFLNDNFNPSFNILDNPSLKPSIETVLHAVMPHKVVLHLHAVEVLTHMVKNNFKDILKKQLNDYISWSSVDYFKPGEHLAQAVYNEFKKHSLLDVVFFKNHGVIIGGDSIEKVHEKLLYVTQTLKTKPLYLMEVDYFHNNLSNANYKIIKNNIIQQLAINPVLFEKMPKYWALYPDQLVFLGSNPSLFINEEEFLEEENDNSVIIFIKNKGVFRNIKCEEKHIEQLECYANVLLRIHENDDISTLNQKEISEILNWDAEKYRQGIKG